MSENNNNSGGPTPETRHKRKVAITTMTAAFLLIGVVWLLYWLVWGQFQEYTDDAYVNGNMVFLMSQIPGTVTEINIDDTQLVTEGQTIIKLDPTDTDVALQHATAALADAVRQVKQIFENTQQAEATLILRKADLVKAQLDLKRRKALVGMSAVSHEEFQHYQTDVDTAEAQYNVALHHLRSTQAMIYNTRLYTHPLVEQAKANFKKAYLDAQRVEIRAPVTGYIAKRSIQVGQRITAQTSMLAIIPLNDIWVDANYKESQLNHLRIGQHVTLYADAYPDVTYHGKVFGLNAGTGSAFSLLPPQNATGNWIKIVQRLPVRIWLDPKELKDHPLQIGLSMRVTTHVFHKKGPMLAQKSGVKPLYNTTIYAQQIANVNTLIDKILKANAPDQPSPRININDSMS
jgi:membrane fusion protein (multidrug efflux system)